MWYTIIVPREQKRNKERVATYRKKGNKTMTNKEFLTHIATNAITPEDVAHATAELEKLNARAASASAAKNAEDAPLLDILTSTLSSAGKVLTAAELAAKIGVHTSKVTNLCKKVPGIKVSDVTVDRRVVKGYSL